MHTHVLKRVEMHEQMCCDGVEFYHGYCRHYTAYAAGDIEKTQTTLCQITQQAINTYTTTHHSSFNHSPNK